MSKGYFKNNIGSLISNLLLFSGSQYFGNKEEQDAYCQLIGFIPRPRTQAEQKAFEKKWTVNSFVKPEFRKQLHLALHDNCEFQQIPEALIFGIIESRYEAYSSKCHVSRVVAESMKAFQ
jgi:hypothetical protein